MQPAIIGHYTDAMLRRPPARRMPRGYVGIRHETIGSDLLSIEDALHQLSSRPEAARAILGETSAARLTQVKPDGWYPIAWMLDILDAVDARMGHGGLMKMGRMLFRRSHAARTAEELGRGRDVVLGIDGMYHHANRGEEIGGWTVLGMDDEHAVLEKCTPHRCHLEIGILSEAMAIIGCPSLVTEQRCFREGDDTCLFDIRPVTRSAAW